MSVNNEYSLADSLQFAVPITVISGQPLLIGTLAGVATESYTSNPTATPTGYVNVCLKGAFFLTVTAATVLSPSTGSAVNPGDKIYADGGTLDATTNVTTGFTLDKASGGVLFGSALDKLASATTGVIRVRLKVGA